jgi:hypothetical protein
MGHGVCIGKRIGKLPGSMWQICRADLNDGGAILNA